MAYIIVVSILGISIVSMVILSLRKLNVTQSFLSSEFISIGQFLINSEMKSTIVNETEIKLFETKDFNEIIFYNPNWQVQVRTRFVSNSSLVNWKDSEGYRVPNIIKNKCFTILKKAKIDFQEYENNLFHQKYTIDYIV